MKKHSNTIGGATMENEPKGQQSSSRIQKDAVLLSMLVLVAWGTSFSYGFFDQFIKWGNHSAAWKVNDVLAGLLLLSFALNVFALRRWQESATEVIQERRAKTALRTAHAKLEKQRHDQITQQTLENAQLVAEIAERKQAEAALRTSEHRYHVLFENVTDAIVMFSREGSILHANRAAEQLLGYPHNDLTGRNLREVATSTTVTMMLERILRVASGERLSPIIELELVNFHKQPVPVEAVTLFFSDPSGRVDGFHCIYRDLRGHQTTIEASRGSDHQLQALVESLPKEPQPETE